MITVLLGDDRARLMQQLPTDYTALDAEALTASELLSSLLTDSLFGETAAFLIKDADKNSAFLAELEKSLAKIATHAEVYLQFEKLAKNTRLYKMLASAQQVNIIEAKLYVDNSLNFRIMDAALAGQQREALALLKKSQQAGHEPLAVLGALNYKLAQVLAEAHQQPGRRLTQLRALGRKFLKAREVLLSGVIDQWLYLATLVSEAALISSH